MKKCSQLLQRKHPLLLSENLAVNSKEQVNGFGYLGRCSSPEQEVVQTDRGLVVLFKPFTSKWQKITEKFGAPFVDFVACDRAA